jgi:hypothetical protein
LRFLRYGFLVVVVLLVAAACSDDTQPADEVQAESSTTTQASTTSSTSTPTSTVAVTTTTTTTTTSKPATIEVVAGDYFYEGVPETVPVGTRLSLFNSSAREFHEMVVFKLDPAEQRTIEELSMLPNIELVGRQDAGAVGVGEVLSVVFAMPESEQFTYVRNAPVLVEEGRYIIFCGIPIGMDPVEARNLTGQGAIKDADTDGVPRHYRVGMMTEIVASG